MKRFYISQDSDAERGTFFSAHEFIGVNEFNEEEWDYVEGTMSYSKAETIEALKYQRENVTDKDIES